MSTQVSEWVVRKSLGGRGVPYTILGPAISLTFVYPGDGGSLVSVPSLPENRWRQRPLGCPPLCRDHPVSLRDLFVKDVLASPLFLTALRTSTRRTLGGPSSPSLVSTPSHRPRQTPLRVPRGPTTGGYPRCVGVHSGHSQVGGRPTGAVGPDGSILSYRQRVSVTARGLQL